MRSSTPQSSSIFANKSTNKSKHTSNFRNAYLRSRVLISTILRNPVQGASVATLHGDNAQNVADFLDRILREKGDILATEEGTSVLSLLCDLVASAQTVPRCYELKGVQIDGNLVGSGGFSDIYRGEYEGQTVCCKVIRVFHHKENTTLVKAMLRELILWAHLSHENVLQLYGLYRLDGEPRRICLLSPWMSKGNLSEYLANYPLTPRIPLVSDVISGLLYLHQLAIVHGDLKAANVLVSDDGRALIADFGVSSIAIAKGRRSSDGAPGGTPRWKAPELLNSWVDAVPTRESDIWSFSCVCYEVLTGKVPFYQYRQDHQVMITLSRGGGIPIRPDGPNIIDDRIWSMMVKCWDYDPRNRPDCGEIQRCIMDLQVPDTRPPASSQGGAGIATLEAVRAEAESRIDYQCVYDNLFRVLIST